MKLIDADNVKKLISNEIDKYFNKWDNTITVAEMETITRDAIDNAPTVESDYEWGYSEGVHDTERPQGEWTNTSPYDDKGECSLCCYLSKKYYKFCPNCGADMRGNNNV